MAESKETSWYDTLSGWSALDSLQTGAEDIFGSFVESVQTDITTKEENTVVQTDDERIAPRAAGLSGTASTFYEQNKVLVVIGGALATIALVVLVARK